MRICLLGLAIACHVWASDATLRIELRDALGKPLAARVMLRGADDKPVPLTAGDGQVLIHPRFPEMGVAARDVCVLNVAAGRYTLVVERGTEYRRVSMPVDAVAGKTVTRQVRLYRWTDMAGKGWWSGDTHVHRAPAEVPLLMDAADLHLTTTLTRWNTRSSLDQWDAPRFLEAGPRMFYSVNNAEDERPWGAALFFNLKEPMALYAQDAQFPSAAHTLMQARELGAFVELEKPIWWAAPVMAALVRPDTIGVAHNHFMEDSVLDNEAWGRPRNRVTYEGPEGLARYAVALYGQFVNSGMRVAASAGSANGVLRSPVGFNRSYVYLGREFDGPAWMAGQKAGRNFVTNGPMLFLTVDDHVPGDVLPHRNGEYLLRVEAETAGALSRVELVVNGAPVNTFIPMATAERNRMVKMARVKIADGGWFAARCFELDGERVRIAHTSPVYVGETPFRSPAALAMMREWIDEYVAKMMELPASPERDEWIALCKRAKDWYQMKQQSSLPLRPGDLGVVVSTGK